MIRVTYPIQLVAAALMLLAISVVQGETLKLSSGEKQTALIELFTSEGCSSCPPAEAWLSALKSDPRLWHELVPVAFHVDYWDYLGWKDPFASPLHSQRQRRYQREGGIRAVYTPGFVVNGREWRGWIRRQDPVITPRPAGRLVLQLAGSQVSAYYAGQDAAQGGYTLNLAVLAFDVRSKVTAGENSGRYLQQDFAVVGFTSFRSGEGRWEVELSPFDHALALRYGLAAWVSPAGSQAPLQAVGGWLPMPVIDGRQP